MSMVTTPANATAAPPATPTPTRRRPNASASPTSAAAATASATPSELERSSSIVNRALVPSANWYDPTWAMQPAMPAAVARTTNTASGPGRSGAPTTVGWLCGVGHGSTAIGCHTTPPTWCGAGSTPSGEDAGLLDDRDRHCLPIGPRSTWVTTVSRRSARPQAARSSPRPPPGRAPRRSPCRSADRRGSRRRTLDRPRQRTLRGPASSVGVGAPGAPVVARASIVPYRRCAVDRLASRPLRSRRRRASCTSATCAPRCRRGCSPARPGSVGSCGWRTSTR